MLAPALLTPARPTPRPKGAPNLILNPIRAPIIFLHLSSRPRRRFCFAYHFPYEKASLPPSPSPGAHRAQFRPVPRAARHGPSGPAAPDIITKGFDAYAKSSSDAVDIWFKGSPLNADLPTKAKLLTALGEFEKGYGKYLGYEIFKVVPLSRLHRNRLRRDQVRKRPRLVRLQSL